MRMATRRWAHLRNTLRNNWFVRRTFRIQGGSFDDSGSERFWVTLGRGVALACWDDWRSSWLPQPGSLCIEPSTRHSDSTCDDMDYCHGRRRFFNRIRFDCIDRKTQAADLRRSCSLVIPIVELVNLKRWMVEHPTTLAAFQLGRGHP